MPLSAYVLTARFHMWPHTHLPQYPFRRCSVSPVRRQRLCMGVVPNVESRHCTNAFDITSPAPVLMLWPARVAPLLAAAIMQLVLT